MYIFIEETITVQNFGTGGSPNIRNKKVVFKNCAKVTHYVSEINNTQIDNAKDIVVVISFNNLIENSRSYLQTSGSLWQYFRDESVLNDYGNIIDISVNDDTSFSFKC